MKSLELISEQESMPPIDKNMTKIIEQDNILDRSIELIEDLDNLYNSS